MHKFKFLFKSYKYWHLRPKFVNFVTKMCGISDIFLKSTDIQLPTQPLDIASLKNTATKMTNATGNGTGALDPPAVGKSKF